MLVLIQYTLDFTSNNIYSIAMYSQLQTLKMRNPALKTILSVGGFAAGSAPFSKITTDDQSRLRFATSAIDHLRKYGFDGLDIDWEYPLMVAGGREFFSNLIMVGLLVSGPIQ